MEIITPKIAKSMTGNQLDLSSRQRTFQAASNNKGGRKISNINWGDKLTNRTLIKASPKPTITSKRV